MVPVIHRIGVRFPLYLALLLAVLLTGGLFWIGHQERTLIEQDEIDRAEATAGTTTSSLKSIMLAGRGDVAHSWLDRIAAQPSIDFAKIYRPDGTEAFRDLKTVQAVNAFLGEQRFSRDAVDGFRHIDESLRPAFAEAVNTGEKVEILADGHVTILYPIHAEQACLACHGYTDNILRGILVLTMPTSAATSRMDELLANTRLGFLAIVLLFFVIAAWLFRSLLLKPVVDLNKAAEIISGGDLDHRIRSQRKDEFGAVANAFDGLADYLSKKISLEKEHAERQKLLTEAVISLSRQTAQEDILRHVGELAMQIVKARYAMVTYIDANRKRHFIPLGVSKEQKEAIGRMPKGEGLLGLFWESGEPVRIADITSHPESVGFPDGHPPMHSLLGVPIVFSGETLGAIYLTDRTDGCEFSKDDEAIISLLASACAIALSNLRHSQSELAVINRRLQSREIELELMNEELTRASEAKNQFLANTSHELRTPLNAIIGFSELLENPRTGELSEKQRRYVDHIHVSSKRLLTIINDLLDISKIEAGMMAIDEIPCMPGQIAQEVVHELEPLASEKHIQLQLDNSCPDGKKVMLDAGKLHHILINLVGNAIKFTPDEGRIDVRIQLNNPTSKQPSVMVTVADTGCGIAKEDQKRIFEPFVQSGGGLNREYGGTGLGLALTQRQVHLLGGSIKVRSELGHGSQFTVELPAESVEDSHRDHAGTTEQSQTISFDNRTDVLEVIPTHGLRPKILIVDEDEARADAVSTIMEQQGYEAYRASISDAGDRCEAICAYLIILGIPAEEDKLHQDLQLLRTHKATRSLPVILMGGTADALEFSTSPVNVMDKRIPQQELLDMISRQCQFIPQHPVTPSVLVIDDEPSVREFLRDTLAVEGFRVLLARDGEEGIRMATDREPDMIILDLMMPKVSGFEVIRQLNQNPITANIPVVIYTAKDLTREEALQLGREAERVLIKGSSNGVDLVRQLHKMELLYPARAQLIDPVLNCFNSRYMNRRLEQEVANARRHALNFSLICWQIDAFKAYSERHGERWGIAALKEILETVRLVTRRGDVCARIGEAKFLLFLPGVSPDGAIKAAEKLRIRIRHQHFPLPDNQSGRLKASFSSAHFDGDSNDLDELMQILEERLKEAIDAGGDQGSYGGG